MLHLRGSRGGALSRGSRGTPLVGGAGDYAPSFTPIKMEEKPS